MTQFHVMCGIPWHVRFGDMVGISYFSRTIRLGPGLFVPDMLEFVTQRPAYIGGWFV